MNPTFPEAASRRAAAIRPARAARGLLASAAGRAALAVAMTLAAAATGVALAQEASPSPAPGMTGRAPAGASGMPGASGATPMGPRDGRHAHGPGHHHDHGHHGPHGMRGDGPRHGGMAAMAERRLDAVGASAEQKARIRDVMTAARGDLQRQRESERALHQQMRRLLAAPQIDAAGAERLRAQIQAGRDASSRRMLQAALDSAAVLTPEQRQRLAEAMPRGGPRMGPGGDPSRRGGESRPDGGGLPPPPAPRS